MCLLNLNCPTPTGHEDATEDFGIYEFVSIPGKMESAQVECVPRCEPTTFACFSAEADCAELSLNFAVWLHPPSPPRRRHAGPWPVWSRPRTGTPPSMTSSDTFQRLSQFAQVTGEMMRNLRSFHLNFLV